MPSKCELQVPNWSTVAYHPKDFDDAVLPKSFGGSPPVYSEVVVNHSARLTLGNLDKLPRDVTEIVMSYMDLSSLARFRLVNHASQYAVGSFKPYSRILLHAPYVLHAIFKLGVATHFTASHIFSVMCTTSCAMCDKFGAFLWIPECLRCCFPCVRQSLDLMPISVNDAKNVFRLSSKILQGIPIVSTLQGTYSMQLKEQKRTRRLLSYNEAYRYASSLHGGSKAVDEYMEADPIRRRFPFTRKLGDSSNTVSYDFSGAINNTVDNITRFMVTIPFPFFDPSSNVVEFGLSCKGCQLALEQCSELSLSWKQHVALWDRRDRTYSRTMFIEHLDHCTEAQHLLSRDVG